MGVTADTIRYVREEVQKTPAASAARHTRVCRWVPPAEDNRHGQGSEEFQYVQRLLLDHHLIRHARRHDDGKECRQCHAHLKNPPVTTNYFKWV